MTDVHDHSAVEVRGVLNRCAYAEGVLLDEQVVPGSIQARHARLGEPHVGELNRWAQQVAVTERRRVPGFDPASGGVNARVLVLLQDPSRVAAYGSRLISRHNNDPTANNTHCTATAAGLPYDLTVHWNVVPWWVQDPDLPAAEQEGLGAAARRARPHLRDLLGMLGHLEVVVLLGKQAQVAWAASGIDVPDRQVLRAPHPSPLAFNMVDRTSGVRNAALLATAFGEAAARVR